MVNAITLKNLKNIMLNGEKQKQNIIYILNHFICAKFRLKLKKVGKITRPFRYDLNQIPYVYTVEATNRFKGLDLRESTWRTMDGGSWHCTGSSDQDHPQEKEMQKGRMVVWGGRTK